MIPQYRFKDPEHPQAHGGPSGLSVAIEAPGTWSMFQALFPDIRKKTTIN
jgi:hypothetical protein